MSIASHKQKVPVSLTSERGIPIPRSYPAMGLRDRHFFLASTWNIPSQLRIEVVRTLILSRPLCRCAISAIW